MTSSAALEPNTPPSNVLVVSLDPTFIRSVCDQLEDRGISAASCESFDDGIEQYDSHRAVITQIPVGNRVEVTQFVDTLRSQRTPGLPRPLLCGIATGDDIPAFPPGTFDSLLPSYVKVDEVIQRVSDHLNKPAPAPPIAVISPPAPRQNPRPRGGILERILAPQGKKLPTDTPNEETKTVDVPALNALPGEVLEPSDDVATAETPPPTFRPAPTVGTKIESPFSLAPVASPVEVDAEIVAEIKEPRELEPANAKTAEVELVPPPNPIRPEAEEPEAPEEVAAESEPAAPEEELPEPPDHYRILVEHAPIALAMFDTEMHYLEANRLWAEAFHLHDTPLKGRSQFDVFPSLHPSWKRIYKRCLKGKTERSGGDRFRRADGSDDWVRWEVRPWIRDKMSLENDGVSAVGGLVISCEVINGMKQEEEKLEFERSLAGALFSTHTAPVMVVGLDGVVLRANPAARKLAPCEQLVENAAPYWNQLLSGDERDTAAELFTRLRAPATDPSTAPDVPPLLRETLHLASGETNVTWLNIPQRTADGSLQAIVRVGTVTGSPEPEPIPEIPVGMPFSAHVVEDEEPEEAEPAPPTVADLAIPVFTCNEQFVPTGGNDAWFATTSCDPEAPTIAEAFYDADWPELEAALRECFQSSESVSHHCRLAAVSDDETPLSVLVEATTSGAGDIIVTVLDDSERTALKLTTEDAEKELAASKSEIAILEEKLAAAEAKAAGMAGAAEELASSHAHQSSDIIPHPSANSLHPATVAAHAPVAFLLLDSDGDLVFANPQHTHLLGTQATEFASIEDWLADRCTDTSHAENIRETWRDKIWRKQATRVLPLLNADNILKDIRFQPRLLRDGSLLLTLADVTETHRGEQALRASEARLRALFRDCGVPVATVDATGDLNSSTRALETLLGYSAREMRQLSIEEILSEDDQETRDALLKTIKNTGVPTLPATIALRSKSGTEISADLQLSKIQEENGSNLTAYVFTPTDSAVRPAAIKSAAADADHRTRNNLQIISTLLNLQRARAQDPAIRDAIGASQGRLRALALVHQHTASGETAFSKFADALSAQILGGEKHLTVHNDLAPALTFPLPKAISLGLCLNELLANTATHAFPDGLAGSARIAGESGLGDDGDPEFTLVISDDGVGLPENFDPRKDRGLGLQIVQSLADQLDASLSNESDHEQTEFRLTIPL